MEKPFFDVFPTLEMNTELKNLFSVTKVTRVAMTRTRDFLKVYLSSEKLIRKKDIYQVENMVEDIPLDLKVAVMGCVVNGPGEAKEADIGIAGGVGEGLLIKKGEVVRKVPEAELLSVLREELLHWNDEK